MTYANWPVGELDTVQRLRVLAAAIPGAVGTETLIEAPFEQVWAVVGDLENELPRYLRDVRSLRLVRAADGRLEAHARGYGGLRARFDVVLRPGWCVMRSRFLVGAMAATADGDRTRFAFLGGVHVPAQQAAAPVLQMIGRWAVPRVLGNIVDRVEQNRM